MTKWFTVILFLVCVFTPLARAVQVVENFKDRTHFDLGTAVWNQELGAIHPSLRVMNYQAGFTPLNFFVGDGSDGPFDITTYANFSVGGDVSGNIIRLDTNAHSVLQVTHFSLAPGWIIQPSGGHQIIIQSLSYVDIQGEIWCQGIDGGNAVGAAGGAAGLGRCGGVSGGTGGNAAAAGSVGASADITVTGGKGGNGLATAGPGVGGGGGGSWNTTIPPINGPNSSVAGGQAGTSNSDPSFTIGNSGSSGGGGGGGITGNGGGGGGGGGGAVLIYAVGDVNIGTAPSSTTGFIFVNGGNGGNGSLAAGPGGGGGGGSVQIFSGGTINIYNTNGIGASQALDGVGGTNGSSVIGANGAGGRSWFSAVTYNYVGTYTPAEQAPIVPGNVEFSSAAEFVDTMPVDLLTTNIHILDMLTNPSSPDFTVTVGGSNDNFVTDDTGFTTDVNVVSGKRYIRMELTVTTSNVSHPTMMNAAIVDFNAGDFQNFQFKAAGCGRVEDVGTPKTNFLLMLLTPLFLVFMKFRKRYHV